MEYCSAIKKENFTLCDSTDARGEHYAEWKKPVRERQILWFPSYVASNEQTVLTSKTETDHRHRAGGQLRGGKLRGGGIEQKRKRFQEHGQ